MATKDSIKNYGSSLKVPSVQTLANQKLESVPLRYIRDEQDQDHPFIHLHASSSSQIPIIDMQKLLSSDQTVDSSELQNLHISCQDWGFFQLVNHGVSSQLMDKVKLEVKQFFNLPTEEKEKFAQKADDVQGFGQAFVFSEEQKLDWADMFYMLTLPPEMRKPHLFLQLPLSFRETLEAYSIEVNNVAKKLLKAMSKGIGMKQEDMSLFLERGQQSVRINNYPPCPQPELVMGITAHSDPGGLTVLIQADETQGLQIKKDGYWTPVSPLTDAFIVNIGDMLEILTNGIYKSVEHRAIVNSDKARMSLAMFHSPKPVDGNWGPAPSLIQDEKEAKFKKLTLADYYLGVFSKTLHGKSNLDALILYT